MEEDIKIAGNIKKECYEASECAYTENKGNCTVGNCFMKSQQLLLNLINNQQIAINKMAKDISSNLLELQKKEKIIYLITKYISTKNYADDICEFRLDVKGRFHKHCYKGECQDCIKQYFEKEAEK